MKLLSPLKLNSQSAFATATVRSSAFPSSRRNGIGSPGSGPPQSRNWRRIGISASVVTTTVAAAIVNGSGAHSESSSPPASSATPRPAPRRIACSACARA